MMAKHRRDKERDDRNEKKVNVDLASDGQLTSVRWWNLGSGANLTPDRSAVVSAVRFSWVESGCVDVFS